MSNRSNWSDNRLQPPITTNDVGNPVAGAGRFTQELVIRDYWATANAELRVRVARGLGVQNPQLSGAGA